MIVEWKKGCNCVGHTSTYPQVTFETVKMDEFELSVKIEFYNGPVCDRCHTPWKRMIPVSQN